MKIKRDHLLDEENIAIDYQSDTEDIKVAMMRTADSLEPLL